MLGLNNEVKIKGCVQGTKSLMSDSLVMVERDSCFFISKYLLLYEPQPGHVYQQDRQPLSSANANLMVGQQSIQTTSTEKSKCSKCL